MIKLFEMFAGYGGASFGLKKANIDFECVGVSEIDKYAMQCFTQNHKGYNYGDCKLINTDDLPDFDLLTGGFPCQDVSIAGNRDLSKGRTNLYLEILRIAEAKKPKFMLLENVKGLLSIETEEGKLINKIIRDLQKLGYGVVWKVLNSKDYGIPQNRERVWFVCKLGGWNFMEFQFPQKEKLKIFLKDILEKDIDKNYYLSEKSIKRLLNNGESYHSKINPQIGSTIFAQQYKIARGMDLINQPITCDILGNKIPNIPEIGEANRIYSEEGISPTIKGNIQIMARDRMRYNKLNDCSDVSICLRGDKGKDILVLNQKTRNVSTAIIGGLQEHQTPRTDGISPSLNSAMGKGGGQTPIINSIRRLTPKECFRLMGFLNDEINLDGLSDTQQYKLAGNGWDINLVSKIFKDMFKGAEYQSGTKLKGGKNGKEI